MVVNKGRIEASAARNPFNHLDLLYFPGRSMRQGYGTLLLKQIELESYQAGIDVLFTEASFFSNSLLFNCGCIGESLDQIEISGVNFHRYLMYKTL